MGCLFCFPELNSKAAFSPPPSFPPLPAILTVRKLLGHIVDMEGRKEGRKEEREEKREGYSIVKEAAKEIYCGQKQKTRRIKLHSHSVPLVFPFLDPKIILTLRRKQATGLCLFPFSIPNLAQIAMSVGAAPEVR